MRNNIYTPEHQSAAEAQQESRKPHTPLLLQPRVAAAYQLSQGRILMMRRGERGELLGKLSAEVSGGGKRGKWGKGGGEWGKRSLGFSPLYVCVGGSVCVCWCQDPGTRKLLQVSHTQRHTLEALVWTI